jgi:hypothetical protein
MFVRADLRLATEPALAGHWSFRIGAAHAGMTVNPDQSGS